MVRWKSWTILMGTLCLMLVVTQCAKKPAESYKVGATFAITGRSSWLGEPERNTAMMIAEKINAAGGINGHLLELIIEDTVGDATKTVNAVNKLIEKDQVLAIIGPSRSGCTMAVVPIVEKAQVPLLSCADIEDKVVHIVERQRM